MQGTHLLVEAFEILKEEIDNLYLVLAGRLRKVSGESLNLNNKRIIWLKELDQKGVVDLINAADIAVVPNTTNEFTKYCFPYKIIEYMACNAKIVATKVGDVGLITPKECLCKPDNVEAIAAKIRMQLQNTKKYDYRKIATKYTWDNIAKKFDYIIRKN